MMIGPVLARKVCGTHYRKSVEPTVENMDFTHPTYGCNNQAQPSQASNVPTLTNVSVAWEERMRLCPSAGCITKSDTDTASEDKEYD